MMRLSILLCSFFLYATLSGCTGFTMTKVTINLDQSIPFNSGVTVRTINLKDFSQMIEEVAVKNGLKCNVYNETNKYFGCGIGRFNLMTYVKEDQMVQVELSEVGPWGKTKRFEKLEKDVNAMLAREFPGQNYTLHHEK